MNAAEYMREYARLKSAMLDLECQTSDLVKNLKIDLKKRRVKLVDLARINRLKAINLASLTIVKTRLKDAMHRVDGILGRKTR